MCEWKKLLSEKKFLAVFREENNRPKTEKLQVKKCKVLWFSICEFMVANKFHINFLSSCSASQSNGNIHSKMQSCSWLDQMSCRCHDNFLLEKSRNERVPLELSKVILCKLTIFHINCLCLSSINGDDGKIQIMKIFTLIFPSCTSSSLSFLVSPSSQKVVSTVR